MKSKEKKNEGWTSGQEVKKYHKKESLRVSHHLGVSKLVWKIDFIVGKNPESVHRVGWKNLIPLFSCLLCCSLRHDHASSCCWKHGNYLSCSQSSFPLPSSCCEDPKAWASSRGGLKPAESGEIPPWFPNTLLLEPADFQNNQDLSGKYF